MAENATPDNDRLQKLLEESASAGTRQDSGSFTLDGTMSTLLPGQMEALLRDGGGYYEGLTLQDLKGKNFKDATFWNCTFAYPRLTPGTALTNANMAGCTLRGGGWEQAVGAKSITGLQFATLDRAATESLTQAGIKIPRMTQHHGPEGRAYIEDQLTRKSTRFPTFQSWGKTLGTALGLADHADIQNADLSDMDLRGFQFDGMDLRRVNFAGAQLDGATRPVLSDDPL